jgi:hypothetical protein
MKRSWIKRKTGLKRKSKSETRVVQDLLWNECRRIILGRYAKNGKNYCFTCEKEIEKQNRQVGHFIPNSVGGALLRYNLDNLRPQCYYCNINLGGNGSLFYKKLLEEKGQAHIDQLFNLKGQTCKAIDIYKEQLELYKNYDSNNI